MKKVLTGMSGGVDSSVSAILLRKKGYDVSGVNLIMHNNTSGGCGSSTELETAREVSRKMDIPFYVFDFSKEFEREIMTYFAQTYISGATPNPCVVCNRKLKFGALLDKADEMGFDYVATGHYARTEEQNGRFLLRKGEDLTKDQSYVLYGLSQRQLSRTLFPLGDYKKTEIRLIAEENGLINAHKHDSQDICFLPDGNYPKFIEKFSGIKFESGDFVTLDGKKLGTHKGIIRYTIGQRKGLGLALPAPMYVYKKDMEKNQVILTSEEMLFSKSLDADNINFIPFDRLERPMRVKAKVRYSQQEHFALVEQTGETTIHVEFEENQRAIAKGQSVVFYDGDYVIGGGTIL